MEQKLLFSIFGLIFGVVVTFVVTMILNKSKEKQSDNIIEKAQKTADKLRRDTLLELKEEQYKLQYQILPIDYSFLDHVSYIDATTVIEISKEILVKSIKNNRTSIKGELSVKDLEGLLAKLRSSKLFSKHDKERYFF